MLSPQPLRFYPLQHKQCQFMPLPLDQHLQQYPDLLAGRLAGHVHAMNVARRAVGVL